MIDAMLEDELDIIRQEIYKLREELHELKTERERDALKHDTLRSLIESVIAGMNDFSLERDKLVNIVNKYLHGGKRK